ncbi:MAG: DUF4105 domain-containing protein [Cyclobacteriaceae bacterium]|nr:DUF4105 domain-containing protein [Cyclobacteriaceae bacterium]
MKKIGLLLSLLLVVSTLSGQTITLSPQAEISVITCGPGQDELYLAFGHSAIRVVDPAHRIDYAYNYGVFDFDQPNFYLNYTKGLLLFKLGVYSYPDFVNSYVYYNRWVTEQVLNLSPAQKQAVFNFLEWNALPENETYRYDYFYNNCASKIRDVLAQNLGDSLRFDTTFIQTSYTIRQLTDLCLAYQPWGDLGIDICLGLPMDKKASPYEYMFLPDYVMQFMDHATIIRNSVAEPLVKKKIPVYMSLPKEIPKASVHPFTAFGLFGALVLVLTIVDIRRKKLTLWFDVILFLVTGLVGFLLLLLWLATDHQAAAKNFNILWAMPTHLLIVGAFFKRFRPVVKKYFLGVAVLSVALAAGWTLLPQQMNIFLLPLVGAIALRSWAVSKYLPD